MGLEHLKALVEGSEVFKEWKCQNPRAYFYLAFALFDKPEQALFELSYFSPDTGLAGVFSTQDKVEFKGEGQLYSGVTPEELRISQTRLDLNEAYRVATQIQRLEHSLEAPLKTLATLQVKGGRPCWVISFLTASFSTLSIRLDAVTGTMLEKTLSPLFEFENGKKGAGS